MKLYELTTFTDDTGANVVRVSGTLADHSDAALRKEWITFQIAIDAHANLGGGSLRQSVLMQVRDICHEEMEAACTLRAISANLPANLK